VPRIEVLVPSYGMTDNDSYIQEWLVEEGAQVDEGTPLLIIETAKAETEIESPATGTVGQLLVPAEAEVAPGTPLTWIEVAEA
jgi:pyruvate/2-oxoglutarate dehydrogenase complex dihydrolipoamide acyltransferase (E2) component